MTGCKETMYMPESAGEVLDWCRENGVVPIPCQPKSKAPMGIISQKGVYKDNPPDERELLREYDRRFFGKSIRDSFHIPSQKRLEIIRNFWNSKNKALMSTADVSISIDMNYPTDDGFTVACIDIDSDDYISLAQEPLFEKCPLVSGKKGAKIFFKLNRQRSLPSPIIQYSTEDNLNLPGPEQKPALIELFTGHKHALIYGEHPDSTEENPLFYHFLRGFGCPLPVITWQDTTQCLKNYAILNRLVIRKTSEVLPYDQTNLSEWAD